MQRRLLFDHVDDAIDWKAFIAAFDHTGSIVCYRYAKEGLLLWNATLLKSWLGPVKRGKSGPTLPSNIWISNRKLDWETIVFVFGCICTRMVD